MAALLLGHGLTTTRFDILSVSMIIGLLKLHPPLMQRNRVLSMELVPAVGMTLPLRFSLPRVVGLLLSSKKYLQSNYI